ncbi:imelysin family protein [Paraglaciecola sp. 2405UD69-4]|uniref:imelysin family protein n=1 Tax=Paraglaciecola sp. 2405UD69-4 TaxID=3391836 RepID=UPI0039C939EB
MNNQPTAQLKKLFIATTIGLTTLLSACGGGGGGGSSNGGTTTPVVETPTTDITTEFGDYLTDLVDGHIIPSYSAMQTQAQALTDTATAFCALSSQTSGDLSNLQQSWSDFNQSWQAIQWLKVGAISDDNRIFRMEFWPDSQEKVPEDVDDLIEDHQQITVTAELISEESVTVQGISALEYLLFPASTSNSLLNAEDKAKRCEITAAISENLLNMSTEILSDWQATGGNYRSEVINGTGEFDSVQEVIEELVTTWLEHIEIVEDSKINEIVGTESPGNPESAEHYLSDESLLSIATNIDTIMTIYTNDDGKGFDEILTDFIELASVDNDITASLTSISAQITQITQDFDSYEAALADDNGRIALSDLVNEMRELIDLIDIDFTQALEISLNFTSSDGD